MSTLCRYCGVTSRNACSDYKRKYLADELRSCPNLDPDSRYGALISAEVNTAQDDEIDRLRKENEELRRK